MSESERTAILNGLTDAEAQALLYDWRFWSRPSQQPPAWDWRFWLILAGRGFGKTRTGAEQVRGWINAGHNYVNLIGATADDAYSIMIDGESGILAICPPHERPRYNGNKRRLEWPNGARSLVFSADEPERLRGKQHAFLWADELAAWRYSEAWDQANFGLRLGNAPQAVITTTPRPTKLIRELASSPVTAVTRGTTYENRGNLAPAFYSEIITKYEGTRLGRQELNAEILEDVEGALWGRAMIDDKRRPKGDLPCELTRVVVAVDPAVTSGEESDETGIVVAGKGMDGRGYVLADLSCRVSPDAWAKRIVGAYREHGADRIIAEVNNGGDLVERVIRTVDRSVSFRAVHASRGKRVRAEPVAALYEQGRVSHVGSFPQLEDQMVQYTPDAYEGSPDRVDALVYALTELMLGGSEMRACVL